MKKAKESAIDRLCPITYMVEGNVVQMDANKIEMELLSKIYTME
jgi:hypothetical protein